jgi:putative hydrolase of the HAD superfamily
MVDVDGVLVEGRPADGRHWQAELEADLGVTPEALHQHFFAPHWDDIIVGRAGLMERLIAALQRIAPHVSPARLVSYWFEHDARLVTALITELSLLRAAGVRVYLATNQEHLRAGYLMDTLGFRELVDGMFYSARLGTKKPEPHFFAKVSAAVGLPGPELLLIDDSRVNVDAALRAGWRALHWTAKTSPTIVRSLYE